jgi:hypothetical protein
MQDHVHTGVFNVVFAGLSALVVIHLLRVAAAQLSAHGGDSAGKVLAAFALAD